MVLGNATWCFSTFIHYPFLCISQKCVVDRVVGAPSGGVPRSPNNKLLVESRILCFPFAKMKFLIKIEFSLVAKITFVS